MAQQAIEQELVGARLDRYEVLEEVGFGGMSVVYRARDAVLGREVALKVLHGHLAKREASRQRLRREARAVAKLRHPNILEIYDYSGEASEHAYLVTELIHGPTLRALVEERRPSVPEIGAMIAVVLADALAHAHELGVLHRDIKPENVMIRGDGVVKLMDFGIARLREAERVTATGSLLGSPAHMAPEVVSGEEPDGRSDIFSLGTVLYFLVTGELPFQGRNAAVVLRRIVEGQYLDPEVSDPRVGRRLAGVVRRCLAVAPEERYAGPAEVQAALRELLEEVGLVDVSHELKQYFADPEGYERELEPRLLTRLELLGQEALAAGQVARAVDTVNRLLAIDDEHEGGRRLLGRLTRRRRIRVTSVLVVLFLALLGVSALAVGLLDRASRQAVPSLVEESAGEAPLEGADPSLEEGGPVEEPRVAGPSAEEGESLALAEATHRAEAELVARAEAWSRGVGALARRISGREEAAEEAADSPPRAEEEASDEARQARRRAEGERLRQRERGPGEVAGASELSGRRLDPSRLEIPTELEPLAEPEEQVTVLLRPGLRLVEITINGEERGDLGENVGGFQLTPGRHEVYYSHRTVEPAVQAIVVPEGQSRWEAPRFPLSWRPAQLIVLSEANGQVFVDGDRLGSTNRPLDVAIRTPRPPRLARVTVVVDGQPLRVFEDVAFEPAERVRLTVADGE